MKVLIIGAGAVASVIHKYLIRDKDVSQVICASNDIKRAKEFIDVKHPKVRLVKIDAKDEDQIVKNAKDVTLIINACSAEFNENIMRSALKVNANYQDLGSYFPDYKTAEQLKYHKKFNKQKLIGLINTGVAPGITNLLVREAADKLDEVFEIKIRLIEDQQADELIFAWSPEMLLREITSPPLVYKNNRLFFSKAFEGTEEYEFPYPIGKRSVVLIQGDELFTIPLYIKTKYLDFKSGGTDIDLAKTLYRLGLFDNKPLNLNGKKIIPLQLFSKIAPPAPTPKKMMQLIKKGVIKNAIFSLTVELIGKQSNKKTKIKSSAMFPDLKEISKLFPGATYISYPTGVAAYAFFKAFKKIDNYGVFPPEALNSEIRRDVLIELENKKILINDQFSKA